MPIKRTYRNIALVRAPEHIKEAARAEKFKPKTVEALWMALTDSQRGGLVAHAEDAASDGWGLAEWRNGFPGAFADLDDRQASALIRVAVGMAGGAIEEVDDEGNERVVDTQAAAKKAKGD